MVVVVVGYLKYVQGTLYAGRFFLNHQIAESQIKHIIIVMQKRF